MPRLVLISHVRVVVAVCLRMSLAALMLSLAATHAAFGQPSAREQERASKREAAMRAYLEAEELSRSNSEALRLTAAAKYETAISLFRAVDEPLSAANVYISLARLQGSIGKHDKAIASHSHAIEIFHNLKEDAGEATAANGLGWLYRDLGEKKKALECYLRALPLYQRVNNADGESITLHSIGAVYIDMGESRRALPYLEKGLQIRRRLKESAADWGSRAGAEFGIGVSLYEIGRAYVELGDAEKSIAYGQAALAIFHNYELSTWTIDALNDLGRAYGKLANRKEAQRHFNLALYFARQTFLELNTKGKTYYNLMELWEGASQPGIAIIYGKQAVNSYQEFRARAKGLSPELKKTYLDSVSSAYRRLAALLISEQRLPEAERVLEMLKEEEYFEYKHRDPAVASALLRRADLSKEERRALEEYSKIGDRLTALGNELGDLEAERLRLPEDTPFPAQARLDELRRALADAERTFEVFQRRLAEEFGGRDARVRDVGASGWKADLQRWEGQGLSNTVLVSTIVGKDSLQVIVTTPRVQEAHTVNVTAAALSQLTEDFRSALQSCKKGPAHCVDPKPAGLELYKILVKPIEGDLAGAFAKGGPAPTVLWSLDGVLRYVPAAALWDGERYVAERFNSVVLTLASRSKIEAGAKPVTDWRVLGLGVSKGFVLENGDTYPELKAVPDELKRIIRQLGPEGSPLAGENGLLPGRRLLNEDFNADRFMNALGRYSVVHIASHFEFRPGAERSSALLLGDGSLLSLDSIKTAQPLFAGVELLTLSACNTAVGGGSGGEEIEGFGVEAQEKGALAVLASLWSVSDESTAELMREFYRVRKGAPDITKAEALRRAQLALLRGELKPTAARARRDAEAEPSVGKGGLPFRFDYAHPYYWAPFILIGNWR